MFEQKENPAFIYLFAPPHSIWLFLFFFFSFFLFHGIWLSQWQIVVKRPLAMQETQEIWVRSLEWEDPLEESMATHSSILAGKISRTEESGGPRSTGHKESDTTEVTEHPVTAHGVHVPRPAIEPMSPALNRWTSREVPENPGFYSINIERRSTDPLF